MSDKKNKVETLMAIKESIDRSLDRKINEVRMEQTVDGLKSKPFTTIDGIFRELSMRLSESKDGERLIRRYAKVIMENKDLRDYYTLCRSVRNSGHTGDAHLLASIMTESMAGIDSKGLVDGTMKAAEVVAECIGITGMDLSELDDIISRSENDLNRALTFLSENRLSIRNSSEWADNIGKVTKHMSENARREPSEGSEGICEGLTKDGMMSILEKSVRGCSKSSWSDRVCHDVIMEEIGGGDGERLFNRYKDECLEKIDGLCENASVEEKSRLDGMRKGIVLKEYKEDTLVSDLLNMSELSEVLGKE